MSVNFVWFDEMYIIWQFKEPSGWVCYVSFQWFPSHWMGVPVLMDQGEYEQTSKVSQRDKNNGSTINLNSAQFSLLGHDLDTWCQYGRTVICTAPLSSTSHVHSLWPCALLYCRLILLSPWTCQSHFSKRKCQAIYCDWWLRSSNRFDIIRSFAISLYNFDDIYKHRPQMHTTEMAIKGVTWLSYV